MKAAAFPISTLRLVEIFSKMMALLRKFKGSNLTYNQEQQCQSLTNQAESNVHASTVSAHAWPPVKAAKLSMHAAQSVVCNCLYRRRSNPLTMPKFRALFSFAKKEVALFFLHARPAGQVRGIKMLVERDRAPEQPACEHSKFLLVIPRKVGKACIRNRLRRQIRAMIYEEGLTKLPLRFALLCYPQALSLSLEEIKTFLTTTLQRFS